MTNYNFEEITNYVETIRTNVDLNPVGLQTLCLDLDSVGVPQHYTEAVLHHNAKQEIVFPLVPAYTYTTTKDMADISGNETSLTITHTDATTVIIP